MAATIPVPDHNAQLQSFLLDSFIDGFHDPRRSTDEQIESRMRLESFILAHGPPMLVEIQRAFNVSDTLLSNNTNVSEWFVVFTSSLNETWVRVLNLGIVERFWRTALDSRVRRRIIELITRAELIEKVPPYLSRVVGLFREVQPDPFSAPMNGVARIIVDTLLARAMLMPSGNVPATLLGVHSLRALRYCFIDRWQDITAAQADDVLKLAGDLTPKHRERLREVLLRGSES